MDVREIWPNEALDFTPWLADNLVLLGEELDLSLEFVERERPVGPYFLDILAKQAGTEVRVAIENQLEWTDFGHLAQLLVYTAGCGARVAIWVATEFRHELAEALHRLNEWTVDGVSFYGVKIEAVRTAEGSEPEARFRKVVYPGGWDENETQPPGRIESEDARKYRKFFEPLIADLARAGQLTRPIQIYGPGGRYFPSPGVEGTWYAASLEGANDAWVTLYIRTTDNDLTKYIFDSLHTDRDQIESELIVDPVPEWHWRRHGRWTFSSISIRRDGSIDDPSEKREVIRTWMLDLLPKLTDVFEQRLEKICDARAIQDQEPASGPDDGG